MLRDEFNGHVWQSQIGNTKIPCNELIQDIGGRKGDGGRKHYYSLKSNQIKSNKTKRRWLVNMNE